jgi:hypothetical protein
LNRGHSFLSPSVSFFPSLARRPASLTASVSLASFALPRRVASPSLLRRFQLYRVLFLSLSLSFTLPLCSVVELSSVVFKQNFTNLCFLKIQTSFSLSLSDIESHVCDLN